MENSLCCSQKSRYFRSSSLLRRCWKRCWHGRLMILSPVNPTILPLSSLTFNDLIGLLQRLAQILQAVSSPAEQHHGIWTSYLANINRFMHCLLFTTTRRTLLPSSTSTS